MAWGQRARTAAWRARRLARTAAVRTQQAAGEVADQFRRLGRRAAGHDIRLMRMARMPERLVRQAAASVLHRECGPLPDPSWVAGYRDVVAAEGVLAEPVAARVMSRAERVPEAPDAGAEPGAGEASGPDGAAMDLEAGS